MGPEALTPEAFLHRSTAVAAAIYRLGATRPLVCAAVAREPGGEPSILNFILTLEYLERAAYEAAMASVSRMTREVRRVLRVIAENEKRHVDVLRETIEGLGHTPTKPPRFGFEALRPTRRPSSSSRRGSRTLPCTPTTVRS